MVSDIYINKYRKLNNLNLNFSKNINIIAGTNGSCKTSLLHIISNSFQAVSNKCGFITDNECLKCIRKINNSINPKIETLTKGDKKYNDPAPDHKGGLYKIKFFNNKEIKFRKHELKNNFRFSVKPYYKRNSHEKLPYILSIYLGLSRLYPYGEYQNDSLIKKIKNSLPDSYREEINALYKKLTGIEITEVNSQVVADIKKRSEFMTTIDGIDSNTISSGEDNLYIILTALISLKYYFDSINSQNEVEGILLIDELDATLHPALQIKLLDIFDKYSKKYKIQIFITTHSLSLIEYALERKNKVIYLVDNITNIYEIKNVDMPAIKALLYERTRADILQPKKICLLMEDDEARDFWKELQNFYCKKDPDGFAKIANYIHLVNISLGANNLINIFSDEYLLKNSLRSICLLDGDHFHKVDLSNNILALPGEKSPETLFIEYADYLCEHDDEFWRLSSSSDNCYTKQWYRSNFKEEIDRINTEIMELHEDGKSHGVKRDKYKKFYNERKEFFNFLQRYWIHDLRNINELNNLYKNLYKLFKKLATIHGIPSNLWENKIDLTQTNA